MIQVSTLFLRRCCVIVFFIAFTVPSLRGLDTVVLTNGDRLTGDVEKLEEGKLLLKTSYAGSISIDWQQVDELLTEAKVEIEVGTGRLYRGSFEQADQGLELLTEDQDVLSVDVRDVVRITSYEDGAPPGFLDILEGALDVGFNFNRGNSRLNASSVGLHGKYRRAGYQLSGSATSLFSRQDKADPTSRQTADARYDRFLSPRQFAFSLLGLERNDRQQLNLRSRMGGGYGYKVKNTKDTELSLLGGFTYINEQFQQDPSAPPNAGTSSGEALAGVDYRTILFRGIGVTTKLSFLPNLVQNGRYRVEYDSTARIPLMGGFNWSLTLFDRFDSKPPRMGVQRNDYGVVTAVGYAF